MIWTRVEGRLRLPNEEVMGALHNTLPARGEAIIDTTRMKS